MSSTVEPVPFNEHFWGEEDLGMSRLIEKMDFSVRDTEIMLQIFTARANLEEDYAKSLASLSHMDAYINTPSVNAALAKMTSLTAALSRAHLQYAEKLRTDLVTPLNAFLDGTQKVVMNNIEKQYEEARQIKQRETANVRRTEKEYVEKWKEATKASEMVVRVEKSEKLKQEVERAGDEYRNAVTQLDKSQDTYEDTLLSLQNTVQVTELARLHLYKDTLTSAVSTQSEVLGAFAGAVYDKMKKAVVEGLNPIGDCNAFATECGTGTVRPRRIVFREATELVRRKKEMSRSASLSEIYTGGGSLGRNEATGSRKSVAEIGSRIHRSLSRRKSGVKRTPSLSSLEMLQNAASLPPLPPLPKRTRSNELLRGLGLASPSVSSPSSATTNSSASPASLTASPASTLASPQSRSLITIHLQLPPGVVPPTLAPRAPARMNVAMESYVEVSDQASTLLHPSYPWTKFYATLKNGNMWLWNSEEESFSSNAKATGCLPVDKNMKLEYGVSKRAATWANAHGRTDTCFTVTILPNKRVLVDAMNEDTMWYWLQALLTMKHRN